jgi:hypothetical protein
MNIQGVVQLRLSKENIKRFTLNQNYNFTLIDNTNYKNHLSDLMYVSYLMKQDFDWDGTPNEVDINHRFENNSKCLLSYYNNKVVGWIWENDNFTPYWKENIQTLNKNEIYVGGAFLSKKVDRPKESGQVFYSIWFDYFLTNFNKQFAYSYVDKWNTHSLQLAYNIGMKEYDFIK